MGRKRKVPEEKAEAIRWYYQKTANSITRIAKHFEISPTLVSRIIEKKPPYDKKSENDKNFYKKMLDKVKEGVYL